MNGTTLAQASEHLTQPEYLYLAAAVLVLGFLFFFADPPPTQKYQGLFHGKRRGHSQSRRDRRARANLLRTNQRSIETAGTHACQTGQSAF
ncbi:MAG: hypothetical protein R6U56_02125 [Opitutales bacterium]